ncbi:hypothetical protein BJ912DRAFT_946983 [Pholiota molesta]|nr:hypothetical protein BJ912DRAFT_946983 [Pholiota molesta]
MQRLWATMASVLACFEIGKDTDEFGNEIEVNDEYFTDGLHKRPFKCSIKPRASITTSPRRIVASGVHLYNELRGAIQVENSPNWSH